MGQLKSGGDGTWVFFMPFNQLVTFAVVSTGLFSDLLDGFLARRWKIASQFGRALDLTADMLLLAVIVTMLAVWGCCRWWFAGFLLTTGLVIPYLVWILRDDYIMRRSKLRKIQLFLLTFYFFFNRSHFRHVALWQGELMRIPFYVVLVMRIVIISNHFKVGLPKIKLSLLEPAPDKNKKVYR